MIGNERKYEAGEGRSHAPRALPLTRLARWHWSPPAVCQFPKQTDGDITLPDPPHRQRSPKEWQNNASRMEFSTCPHAINFAHLAACSWYLGVPKQRPCANVAWHAQPSIGKGRTLGDSLTMTCDAMRR